MKTIRDLVSRVLSTKNLSLSPDKMVQFEDDSLGFDPKSQKKVLQAILIWIDKFEISHPALFEETLADNITHEDIAKQAEIKPEKAEPELMIGGVEAVVDKKEPKKTDSTASLSGSKSKK